MKVIILAAGQGTRLRPLTDEKPKCMVEIQGKSIIQHQLGVMFQCGVQEQDITIVCGYKSEVLKKHLFNTLVNFVYNKDYKTTNMVCSLMCAMDGLNESTLISYGDIVYSTEVLQKLLNCTEEFSVVVDDHWLDYWKQRCDDPLSDAETLKFDENGFIIEIGQKAEALDEVEAQYIGLMKFGKQGIAQVINLANEAKRRSEAGKALWRTARNYSKMYMTDLLQGLIDEGNKLYPIHIQRDWFEVDNMDDLALAEDQF